MVAKVSSVVSAVTGFLAHHITDLTAVHSALSELVSVAPIDSQDKDRINSVLTTIEKSAKNINSFLKGTNLTDNPEVVVKESDLVAAVALYLASDEGKAAIKAAEGNGNG